MRLTVPDGEGVVDDDPSAVDRGEDVLPPEAAIAQAGFPNSYQHFSDG